MKQIDSTPLFFDKVPLLKEKIKEKDLKSLREFLIVNNQKNDIKDIFDSKKEIQIKKNLPLLKERFYLVGGFKIINSTERTGNFVGSDSLTFYVSDKIYEEYGELFLSENITGKFGIEKTASLETELAIVSFEKLSFSIDSIEPWINFRKNHSLNDWISTLLGALNVNSSSLLIREKIIILARLLPFLENNFYYLDLGNKSVLKSTIFSTLDKYVRTVSLNAKDTDIMFNKKTKTGAILENDILVFDEIKNKTLDSNVAIDLQKYLDDGTVLRSNSKANYKTSLVFLGNLDHEGIREIHKQYSPCIFDNLKLGSDTGAFLDRFSYFNPSWGIRRISDIFLSETDISKNGIIPSSYFTETLHFLKNMEFDAKDFFHYHNVTLEVSDIRTENAILKNFSALVKLYYPQWLTSRENILLEEFNMILFFAIEGIYNLKSQLHKMDSINFPLPLINYFIPTIGNIDFPNSTTLLNLIDETYPDITNYISGHRISVENDDGSLSKIALDAVGVIENKKEFNILTHLLYGESPYLHLNHSLDFSFLTFNRNFNHDFNQNSNTINTSIYFEYENSFLNYLYGYIVDPNLFNSFFNFSTFSTRSKYSGCPHCKNYGLDESNHIELFICSYCGAEHKKTDFI